MACGGRCRNADNTGPDQMYVRSYRKGPGRCCTNYTTGTPKQARIVVLRKIQKECPNHRPQHGTHEPTETKDYCERRPGTMCQIGCSGRLSENLPGIGQVNHLSSLCINTDESEPAMSRHIHVQANSIEKTFRFR